MCTIYVYIVQDDQYCTHYFCYIVHIVLLYYCALSSNFVHIVHYCTLLYGIVYKIAYSVSGPRWRGARLLSRRLAGLIPLLVLLRPIPAAAPRRFSSNALPLQITTARFTFQNHRCDDLRRHAQGSWPPPAAAAQAANARPSSAVELRKAWT